MPKRLIGKDVLTAARERIAYTFDHFARVYVSFSGGKDSGVMLHMVAEEARRRGRKFGLLFVDLEAQYQYTIRYIEEMYALYADTVEPFWISLPIILRNAVSTYSPRWMCWDPDCEKDWVRNPPAQAITDETVLPFFTRGMEFEEFTPAFGRWYANRGMPEGFSAQTACFVGIRADESLNRFRTISSRSKDTFHGLQWTTWLADGLFNVYPIYDWKTEDVWRYYGKAAKPYNRLYDVMHRAGLTIHQQRICQPYGDDQRKGLWLYQIIEPETWGRVVARVNGANSGAIYAREHGNINGTIKVTLPEGHTWESFARMLLDSMPQKTREHYEDKIAVFLRWWWIKGVPVIPDEANSALENAREAPSWRRICKALLRNDYWCKGLSFTQTKSDSYEAYRQLMKRRRDQWKLI